MISSLRCPLAILITATLLAAGACSRPARDAAGSLVTLRYRLHGDPPTLDPARSHDITSEAVIFEVFDGLVGLSPSDLSVVPAVAGSWEFGEGGRSYVFHLRDDVRFHNGRPVTADDVVWSFERALRRSTAAARPWVFEPVLGARAFRDGEAATVEGFEAIDDHTVRITLEEPFGPFLSFLALEQASILPREVYEDPDKGYLEHPVGCGPFRMREWRRGRVLILEAFPDYYGDGPHVDRVEYRMIADQETALQAFRAGNLEISDEVPSGTRQAIREEMGAAYKQWPQIASRFIAFNHARPPFRGNRALRRALNHAIDREYILRVLDEGKDVPIAGILPPGLPSYDPDLEGYDYDPDLARALLVEAGYPGGQGLPELTLLYNTNPGHRRILERIVADLAEIGVRVRPRDLEMAAYLEAIADLQDDLLYFAWVADFPDAYTFLHTNLHSAAAGKGGNYSRYANPAFDEVMDRAVREPDPGRRIALYREAERIAVEDAALLFFYAFQDEALVRPEVQGLELSPLGDFAIPLERVRLEPRSP